MLAGFPPVGGPLKLLGRAGPLHPAPVRPAAARLGRAGWPGGCSRHPGSRAWLYSAALHGDTPPDGAGLGDRRVLSQPARPRGRLAQPARRRAAADRRAGRPTCAAAAASCGRARRSTRILSAGGRVTGVALAGRRDAAGAARDRHGDAAARCCGWPATRSPPGIAPGCGATRPGAGTMKLDWALDGPIPWENEATRGAGHRPRRRRRAGVPRVGRARRRTACPSARSCCWASSPWPIRPARRRASTPPGPTRTARPRADWSGARRAASRRRSSATRPGSATGSWPATCSGRQTSRRATRTSSAGTSAAAATGCARSVFRPLPKLSPYTHAAAGPVPGRRVDVPGRRGARRAGRRGGPRRAAPRRSGRANQSAATASMCGVWRRHRPQSWPPGGKPHHDLRAVRAQVAGEVEQLARDPSRPGGPGRGRRAGRAGGSAAPARAPRPQGCWRRSPWPGRRRTPCCGSASSSPTSSPPR